MNIALCSDDQWVTFDSYTYLVHTDKPYDDMRVLIGIHMEKEIDDFMVMQLDRATAMSTFTDRHDIIKFLKSIDIERNEVKVDQVAIDGVLDKLSRFGRSSLSDDELLMLSRF
jgi:hypothetical protein